MNCRGKSTARRAKVFRRLERPLRMAKQENQSDAKPSSSHLRGSRTHDFFECGLGHAGPPSRIAQLESVPAWIEEIKLPSRKITLGAVGKLDDGNFLFVKYLARLHERLRADRE